MEDGVMDGTEDEQDVLNTKLMVYDIKVSAGVRNICSSMKYDNIPVLNMVVTNLIACVRRGNLLVYGRRHIGAKGKKKITSRRVVKCIDFLVKEGYIINCIGKGHIEAEYRSISYCVPTKKFIDKFVPDIKIMTVCESAHAEAYPVIELRDVDKNPVEFRKTKEVLDMSDLIQNLNKVNDSAVITDGKGRTLTNMYCRIFNESFDRGGRFYRADVLRIKNSSTKARLDIMINGIPVVEVDYNNLHFRIAAAIEGVDEEDVPLDVYSGIIPDEDNEVDRKIVKLAVNIMFNCTDEKTATKAIQGEINRLSEYEKRKYSLGIAKSVMLLIYDAYPQFTHLFCSEDSYGRELQFHDSQLAADILAVFVNKGVPCLPVHDSFIVQQGYEHLLLDTMGDCFRKRFGASIFVPVSISYKDEDGYIQKRRLIV